MYAVGATTVRSWSPWRVATSTVTVALAVGFGALVFSMMLGFGVNERCTSNACATADCPPCERLDQYAYLHAAAQTALAVVATAGIVATVRRTRGRRAHAQAALIAVAWFALAALTLIVYNDAAWDWANNPR
jgi:hypothetical protein